IHLADVDFIVSQNSGDTCDSFKRIAMKKQQRGIIPGDIDLVVINTDESNFSAADGYAFNRQLLLPFYIVEQWRVGVGTLRLHLYELELQTGFLCLVFSCHDTVIIRIVSEQAAD